METDADTHRQALGTVQRILLKMGKEDYRSQMGQGHHKKTHRINKSGCTGAHRNNWQSGSLHGSDVEPLCVFYSCVIWCFCGTSKKGAGAFSDAFVCFCNPRSPTGLRHAAIIWGQVPNLIATLLICHVRLIALEGLSFSEGKRIGWGGRRWGVTEEGGELQLGYNIWENQLIKYISNNNSNDEMPPFWSSVLLI